MIWPFKNKRMAELEAQVAQLKNETSITDSQAFQEMFTGAGIGGKTIVNQSTAMTCSAVFSCVRLISGAVASCSIKIYQRRPDGSAVAVPMHPYRKMLDLSPNDHITASTFWKAMATHKVLNGNAYAHIIRNRGGRAVAVVPVAPQRCTPYQAWEIGLDDKLSVEPNRLYYSVTWDNGTVSLLDQDDMIHVPNIGWNGKEGLSTIKAGAVAMGLALDAEESASGLFTNGLSSQVAISYQKPMLPEAQTALREHIKAKYSGRSNHHTPLILTDGGDVKTINMNADDAQLLESRQFSVIDIARFFGVDPVLIGEKDKQTSFGSGVEQIFRAFHTLTMNDHFTDIEQELEKKLFRGSGYFCKFDESELTRGDTKTRAEYNKAAVGGTQNPGWLTINEIRKSENMPPIDGGDKLYVPVTGEKNDDK